MTPPWNNWTFFFARLDTEESKVLAARAQPAVLGRVVGVSQVLNLELVCPDELEVSKADRPH